MFVDYGDTHLVPSTSLRQLSVLNRYVPPFAVGCTFRSYVQVGELEQEKVLAFTDCTDGIVCHAVFGEKVGDLQIVESLYAGDINVFKLLFGDREVENLVEIQVSAVISNSSLLNIQFFSFFYCREFHVNTFLGN